MSRIICAAYTDYKLIQSMGGSRIIMRAEGCYHLTIPTATAILDAMAGLWCVQVGYGRKELADAAHEQMMELPFYNTFFKTSAPSTVMLAAKVAELLGGNLSHVFFNNSGSEAIDTVIRMVRYYWQVKGKPERNVMIARKNAYHGSTIAGTSLGGMDSHAQAGRPLGAGHRARHAALFIRRRLRRERGGFRRARGERAWKSGYCRSGRRRSPRSSPSRCRARAA